MALSDEDKLTVACPKCKHTVTKPVMVLREALDPMCINCGEFLSDAIDEEFVRQGLIQPRRKRI